MCLAEYGLNLVYIKSSYLAVEMWGGVEGISESLGNIGENIHDTNTTILHGQMGLGYSPWNAFIVVQLMELVFLGTHLGK